MDIRKVTGIFKVTGLESYHRCRVARSISYKMLTIVTRPRSLLGLVVKYIHISSKKSKATYVPVDMKS